MGGNYSYNKTLRWVRGFKRTHHEYHDRLDGHKILLLNKNPKQVKVPVNANSESPLYLCAKQTGKDSVMITLVGIYENHKCIGQIDLKFDKDGNFIPFSSSNKNSSHFHEFHENTKTGQVGRKSHDKKNTCPIAHKYDTLIKHIEDYNKKNKHGKK